MMKKLALNLLRSADEKLRSLGGGKHQNQHPKHDVPDSPRYAGLSTTCNREVEKTSTGIVPVDEDRPPTPPPPYHPPDQSVYIGRFQPALVPPRPSPPSSISLREIPIHHSQSEISRSQNHSVERNAENNMSHPVKHESSKQPRSAPTKRRSRSAGSGSKSRPRNAYTTGEKNLYDNRENTNPRLISKQKPMRHSMFSEHSADDAQFPDRLCSSGSTDSETGKQRLIKSPFVVKRVRKTDNKASNKSAIDITDNIDNRVETITGGYTDQNHRQNVAINQNKNMNPQSNKNKFQKLEERRKQRMDISVTSDEEIDSPEGKISRLRQRALQGSKLAIQLPDRLEDLDMKRQSPNSNQERQPNPVRDNQHSYNSPAPKKQTTHREPPRLQQVPNVTSPRCDQQGNDSSSSDQIFLRPFGPGTRHLTPSPHIQRRTQPNIGPGPRNIASNPHNQRRIQPSVEAINPKRPENFPSNETIPLYQTNMSKPIHQSGYRKIPKQESDYWGHADFNLNTNLSDQSSFWPTRELQSADVVYLSDKMDSPRTAEKDLRAKLPQILKSAIDKREKNIHCFQDLSTNSPHILKTSIDRIDNTRRSQSDDSLDELIESNIQYLESEIESGKLKQISSTQPAAFPTKASKNQYQFHFDREERSQTPPLSSSDFQKEVLLRLHPSVGILDNKQEFHDIAFSSYDNKLSSYDNKLSSYDDKSTPPNHYDDLSMTPQNGSMSHTSASTYNDQFYSRQITVPKVENCSQQYAKSSFSKQLELNRANQISNSEGLIDNEVIGSEFQPHFIQESCHMNVHNSPNREKTYPLSQPRSEHEIGDNADFDIEVAERVKTWEKHLTHKPEQNKSDKDSASLIAVLESEGGIPDSWLQDGVNNSSHSTEPQRSISSISVTVKKSISHIHPKKIQPPLTLPGVLSINKTHTDNVGRTNTMNERVNSVMKVNTSEHSSTTQTKSYTMPAASLHRDHKNNNMYVSSTEPFTLNTKQNPMSQSFNLSDLQHKSKTDRERLTKSQYFPDERDLTCRDDLTEENDKNIPVYIAKQSWPPRRRKHMTEEQKQARLSRYDEEINELQQLKQDNVKDLKRRFDSEASGNESTDLTDDGRSANRTPLIQRRKLFPKTPHSAPSETATLDDREVFLLNRSNSCMDENETERSRNLQEEEVWSPKLESKKGLVSMERVKARTLQTIPFSEDPFWQEIENMTTFDEFLKAADSFDRPRESVAYIKRNSGDDVRHLSDGHVSSSSLLTSPLATTLLTNKSFPTPVIKPLKLNTASGKRHPNTLDGVLEDIRSSLDRKPHVQVNPNVVDGFYQASGSAVEVPSFRRSESAPVSKSASLSRSQQQNYIEKQQQQLENELNMNKYQTLYYPELNKQQQQDRLLQHQKEQYLMQQQHIQQYHEQQEALQQQQQEYNHPQFIPEYNFEPYIVNGNYELDPSMLKEALLDTGLAEFSDIESVVGGLSSKDPLSPVCKGISDAEKEVNDTVEQLTNLAKDVEIRLSQIRDKMEYSDENRLDSVLSALRKVTPTTQKSRDVASPQTVKLTSQIATDRKSKLEETLLELDKIYGNLTLDITAHVPIHCNTIPRQTKSTSGTNVFIRPQIKKRTKSDSDYSVSSHTESESLADIERQTQKEFDDITRAFQNLLAEVDSDKNESLSLYPTYTSKEYQTHAQDIEATIDAFLKEYQHTGATVRGSSTLNKAMNKINEKQVVKPNTCRDIQKSEFFTTSSGPFAVAVGINGHGLNRRTRQAKTSNNSQEIALIHDQTPKVTPLSWQTNKTYADQASVSTKENATSSTGSSILVTNTRGKSENSETQNHDRKKIPRRFQKSRNYQHRKSLPADILQRSVETQTMEDEIQAGITEVTPDKLQSTIKDSASNDNSIEQACHSQKKAISTNTEVKLGVTSSREDELLRHGGLRHSLSAPDLYSMLNFG